MIRSLQAYPLIHHAFDPANPVNVFLGEEAVAPVGPRRVQEPVLPLPSPEGAGVYAREPGDGPNRIDGDALVEAIHRAACFIVSDSRGPSPQDRRGSAPLPDLFPRAQCC